MKTLTIPIYGHGNQAVYIYYYQRYKIDAQKEGYEQWPCKIGYSKHNAISRVEQQAITSSPERPIIGAIIKTNDGYLLEQALHSILKLFHQQVPNATGKEWFMTNPQEIINLCQILRQT